MIYLWPFMRLLATIALFFVPTLTAFGAENLQDCYKGRNAHKMGNYDLAIAYQTRCIDHGGLTDDNLEAAYTRRGASYGRKGEYDRAIADYTAVIRLDPNNAFAYNNRGTAYHLKDEYDRAIRDFDRVIDLNPVDPFAYDNRANVYADMRNYGQATGRGPARHRR